NGYRVTVGINGPADDLDLALRAEPNLTRAEIISLITTGRTDTGALGGNAALATNQVLGSAASLLSEEFISKPIQRETEQFLGLNRFQIDPVLRPNGNPAARITLGRQLTQGLSFI